MPPALLCAGIVLRFHLALYFQAQLQCTGSAA